MITYEVIHRRVKAERGPASNYRCVSCGGRARHWAYDHADDNEIVDDRGRRAYSTRTSHYHPLCAQCHNTLDIESGRRRVIEAATRPPCARCGAGPGQYCRSVGGRKLTDLWAQHACRRRGLDLRQLVHKQWLINRRHGRPRYDRLDRTADGDHGATPPDSGP